jgi:hypothetical protein
VPLPRISSLLALVLFAGASVGCLAGTPSPAGDGDTTLASAAPLLIRSVDEYKVAVARAIHAGNPQFVHDRRPQALLRAVVALDVKFDEHGYVATVRRQNTDEPALTARALESLKRAVLVPVPEALRAELAAGFVETWLFETDGTFQVAAIARKQKSE